MNITNFILVPIGKSLEQFSSPPEHKFMTHRQNLKLKIIAGRFLKCCR